MSTNLSQICNTLSACELADNGDGLALELLKLMEAYRAGLPFRRQTPGFKKL